MNIRVFGADSCKKCQFYLASLKIADIDFQYIDSLADENQELCDQYEVTELPLTQIIDEQGNIKLSVCGTIDVVYLMKEKLKLEKEEKNGNAE